MGRLAHVMRRKRILITFVESTLKEKRLQVVDDITRGGYKRTAVHTTRGTMCSIPNRVRDYVS